MHSKYFKCAGITVELRSDFPIGENTLHPKFKKFETDGPGDDNVLIQHHFYWPELTDTNNKEIYNNDQWQIFRGNDSWIYNFTSALPVDPGLSTVGIFNDNYTSLSVYTKSFNERTYQNACLSALTLLNNDQVMFAKLLCDRNGLILHSNGFDVHGNGILLTGQSGVGKSTLSGMLKHQGFKILCDDRMFLSAKGADFWIHGNWCHGTVPDTSANSLPLKAVLFLEQSLGNKIEEINNKQQITHHLLRSLVQPFLAPDGWHKTFDIIEGLVCQVRCYRVKFDLSGDICNVIEDIFKREGI